MFKKQRPYQTTLFGQPLFSKTAKKQMDDENAWQNEFYRNITCKIDEGIFAPLYSATTGRPNASIRVMVAMRVLKEGMGCSDAVLFEQARFNLLVRRALGLHSLDDEVPVESSYYKFYALIERHLEEKKVDLYEKAFKSVTRQQVLEYNISGRVVRMDSKLIGSNIASYSRYRIVQTTLVKALLPYSDKIDQLFTKDLAAVLSAIMDEDAEKTVYKSDSESLNARFLGLGRTVHALLTEVDGLGLGGFGLLRRVFGEQYRLTDSGNVEAVPAREISPQSVQNPNDPDATYRNKRGMRVKGYSHNDTQLCDDKDVSTSKSGKTVQKPKLVVHVDVRNASTPDTAFTEDGISGAEDVTGQHVEMEISDGGYYSPDNADKAEARGTKAVFTGIAGGRRQRFLLEYDKDGDMLNVTDSKQGGKTKAKKVRDGLWRIDTHDDGKKSYRYFTMENVKTSLRRHITETLPAEIRKMRNNIEADMFQLSLHTRNNKTRYRGLFKQKLFSLARELWVNCVRLTNYDLAMAM